MYPLIPIDASDLTSSPFINVSIKLLISDIGIANPIPSIEAVYDDDDDAEYFAELIPTTSPALFNNAPPLFPPLIAASI